MAWFLLLFLLVVAFTIGASLSGAVIQRILRFPVPNGAPERLPFFVILGVAFWLPILCGLTALGLSFRRIAIVVAIGIVLALIGLAARRTPSLRDTRSGLRDRIRTFGIISVGLLIMTRPLWPAVGETGYYPFNDAFVYVSISDWLQEHSFSEPVKLDSYKPTEVQVYRKQVGNLDMGGEFLLALMQAFAPGRYALDILPAALAWAYFLNLMALALVCRWSLRLPGEVCLLGVVLIGLAGSPLAWSVAHSFLRQVFGLPFLFTTIAVCSRFMQRRCDPARYGVAAGLVAAAALTVYNEAIPVLAMSLVLAFGWRIVRADSRSNRSVLVRYLLWMIGSCAVFANVELYRMAKSLPGQLSLTLYGWHIPLSGIGFIRFALGVDLNALLTARFAALNILWSLVLGLLLVSGAAVAFRRTDSSFPLLSLITVFVGLALYVRFFSVDPWTGTAGHTWQLFKTAKWAYLGIAALQVAGILEVTRLKRLEIRIALLSLTAAFVLVPALSASCENYASERRQLETVTGSSRPASAFRELRSKFSQMQFQSLYMIRSVAPPSPWPDLFYAYLLSPFRLASDWSGTYYFDDLAPFSTKGGAKPLGTALMVTTSTVALRDKANLSMAGLAVINPSQPALVSIRHPNGIEQEGTFVWLDNRPAEIIISPAGAARLALGFDLAPGPNLPDPKRCTLRLNLGGETRDLAVTIPSPVWLDLNLHRQPVEKVTVSALDRGIVSTSTRDSRTLLVSLRNTRLLAQDSWRLFNPNGIDLERSDVLTFWLGPPASLLAFSTRGGWADVRFEASPGPSLPERPDRTIRIRLGSQTVAENHLTKPTTLQFRCPLSAGINQLQLEVVERPSISQLPNGDSRTLMVRVTDFSVQLQTNP